MRILLHLVEGAGCRSEIRKLPRGVSHKDIIHFFGRNMGAESLGAICNAHKVHADHSKYGALDENCIKLAELASIAVDFPKTGICVNMPSQLGPNTYPDLMGKEELQSNKSNKILESFSMVLGQLPSGLGEKVAGGTRSRWW